MAEVERQSKEVADEHFPVRVQRLRGQLLLFCFFKPLYQFHYFGLENKQLDWYMQSESFALLQ